MNRKMKHGLIFVLVFMLLCNSVSFGLNVQTVHAENETTSIIKNGDFEKGTIMTEAVTSQGSSVASTGTIGDSGWTWYTGVAGASFQVVNESQENNNKVMKISHSSESGGSGTIMYSYTPALTDGATYKITVKVKAENVSGSYLFFTLGGQKMDAAKLLASACGDTWYTHTFEYTLTGADAKSRLEIAAYSMKAGGNWLIDDVSIEPVAVNVTDITLNKETLELTKGAEETLIATVAPENATDKTVLWKSSNDAIATVDDTGKVTAVAKGEAIITATSKADSNISATCAVTVTEAEGGTGNTNIIVNGDFENGTVMTEAVTSQGSSVASTGTIGDSGWTWYTGVAGASFQVVNESQENNNKVMKISHSSESGGSGTIMYSYTPALTDGATYEITVKVKAENVSGSYLFFTLGGQKIDAAKLLASACGDTWYTYTFEYTLTGADAKSRLEIAAYSMKAGGNWLIDDVSITKVGTEETTPVDVTGITLNKTELALTVDAEETLSATVAPENATDKTVSWSSSNDAVATVVNGKVTAKAVGTATITATTTNGKSATCTVTVTAAQHGEPGNTSIVKNGDFEKVSDASVTAKTVGNGGTAGIFAIGTSDWNYYMASSYTVNMQFDITAEGRGDSGNAMKISNAAGQAATTEGRGVIRQDGIALPELEAGANYQLTIHAKASDDIHTGSYIQLRWIKGDRTKETTLNKASSVDENGWSVYTIELNKENSVATGNGIQIYAWNMGTGYWLIDDVSIKKVPVITIDKTEVNLEIGKSAEIEVSLTDDDKVLGENPTLTYSSNDTTVATVAEENGTVTINAVGVGEAVITVKSADESVYAECVVKVTPKKIIVNGDFAAGLDNNWTTGTATDVTYTSVAEGRTDNALKVALSDGGVTGAVSGSFKQLLDAKVTEGLVANGSKYLVTVYAKPVGANRDSAVNVSWYDSESATAKTSEITANTTAGSDGWIPVIFEFTAGDVSIAGTNLEVQVSNLISGYWLFDDISIKRVPYVSLTPAEMNIVVSERAEIDATMIDPDYILDKSGAFDYSSADESIAKVDLRGRVTGVSVGTTTITVTSAYYPEYNATLDVTVSAIGLTAISLPESLNLCVAEQEELSVTFTPANATNQAISWTSSDAGVAVVDENGLVTGINAGTATITATGANNLTASCTVTVRKSTTLLTEDAKITSTTYQEVVDSFVEFVTNNTGAEASYSIYEAPENGVLTVNENGSFSYIPRNGQVGDSETFTVIVNAGTEYAFLKGTIELVETIDDSDTPSDSDAPSDSDTSSDSDTDTDSAAQAPEIVESATDDSYTLGSNAEVTIKSTGDFAKFESVEMDGKVVDPSNYEAYEGSTVIKFKSAYLETLSEGVHIVTINYKDGSDVDAKLTLVKKADTDTNTDSNNERDNESDDAEDTEVAGNTADSSKASDETKTGDNSNMGLWLLLLAAAVASLGCAGCTLYKKNKGGK